MNSRWKTYLLYTSLIIVGGGLLLILIETVILKNTGFETKTLWDWMELLIIPLFLAGGAFFLNRSERKTEREIATDRQQEASLQAYIDRISELLLKEKLRTSKRVEVRDVARTRTLSIMRVLDTRRNNLVIHFLREAKLINSPNSIFNHANMQEMNLQRLNFHSVSLYGADLRGADLEYANFFGADLQGANFGDANLQGARLNIANLEYADFKDADLEGANLRGANLKNANFMNAKVSKTQLEVAKSLKGAVMPDMTFHE